jgi:hypothetical protein
VALRVTIKPLRPGEVARRLDLVLVDDVIDGTGSTSPKRKPMYASLTDEYTFIMMISIDLLRSVSHRHGGCM